jgi:Lon protease-like protein
VAAPVFVPVFPLPDVVLFPGVRLPLHVFELRYRTLVRDALAGVRTLAIATLTPGWERDYHGSPAFHPVGCLAEFEQVQWLPNDCYDLVVAGTQRVRLGGFVREFPYRACEAEVLPVTPYDEDDPLVNMERHALLAEVQRLLPLGPRVWSVPPETGPRAGFEQLVNTLAHALRLETATRLEMLALDSAVERARRLGERMRRIPLDAPPQAPAGEGSGLN